MNSTNDPSKSDRLTESDDSPRHEEIASLAYKRYLEEGCPEGRALDHWLQAESQLKRRLPEAPAIEAGRYIPGALPASILSTEPQSKDSDPTSGSTLLSATPATAPIQKEGSFFSEEQAAKTVKRGRKPRGTNSK